MTTPRHTGPHPPDLQRPWTACAPFERLLNMTVDSAENGRAVLTMPVVPELAQGAGVMHGGALVALADSALVMAVKSVVPPKTHFNTVDLQSRFVAPVNAGMVTAAARIEGISGRHINGTAIVTDASGKTAMTLTVAFCLSGDALVPTDGPWAGGQAVCRKVPAVSNLFAGIPRSLPEEYTEILAGSGRTRVERIVSRGHASPEGFWFDQSDAEWVVLLSGKAILEFESPPGQVSLTPGDGLTIPAGCRHRVVWTDPGVDTVWLAVHYPDSGESPQGRFRFSCRS